MIISIPKEIKNNENRVAITPAGVKAFCQAGHYVLVQKSAGLGSGIEDIEFSRAGATIINTAELLQKDKIEATVLHIPTIKPIDVSKVIEVAKETGAVVT